jgi:hypothetical protein
MLLPQLSEYRQLGSCPLLVILYLEDNFRHIYEKSIRNFIANTDEHV